MLSVRKVKSSQNGEVYVTAKSCPFASDIPQRQHVQCGTWCPLCQLVADMDGKKEVVTGIRMCCGSTDVTHDAKIEG